MRLRHLTLTSALACVALAAPAAASAAPSVTASGPATAARGVDYQLDLEASGFTKIACGLGYQVDWNDDGTYEDAVSSYYPHVLHRFGTLGAQTVRVRAETGVGHLPGCVPPETAETTKTVTVANAAPQVEIHCGDGEAEAGAPVTCAADVLRDPDGVLVKLEWDADGDGFDDGTGDELHTSFPAAGDKTVRLRATDDSGNTTVGSTVVEVFGLGAGPAFTVSSQTVRRGQAVTFTAPFGDDEGGDKEYERRWDVDGDGDWDDAGTDRSVTWFYDAAGTYTVRLRVQQVGTDPRTATLSTRTVVVTEPDPAPAGGEVDDRPGPPVPGPGPAPAPAPAPPATAPVVVASRTTTPKVAAKKKSVKRTCRTVKAKKGRKARKVCTTVKRKAARRTRRR